MIEGFFLGFICGFAVWAAIIRLSLAYGFIRYRGQKDD
jgi:hypothetical protein